ncbi:hypothetical protein IV203_036951 [Nitzschia inconspicua]|uniref:Uncharacterized protein n=1 Tax=Nitzschia inconspicua TaxID=303405 RepID=A0A9K3LGB9_9STRA|nr:hypothetical protein IV203_036951 [Nitzschia inconspicua]
MLLDAVQQLSIWTPSALLRHRRQPNDISTSIVYTARDTAAAEIPSIWMQNWTNSMAGLDLIQSERPKTSELYNNRSKAPTMEDARNTARMALLIAPPHCLVVKTTDARNIYDTSYLTAPTTWKIWRREGIFVGAIDRLQGSGASYRLCRSCWMLQHNTSYFCTTVEFFELHPVSVQQNKRNSKHWNAV